MIFNRPLSDNISSLSWCLTNTEHGILNVILIKNSLKKMPVMFL